MSSEENWLMVSRSRRVTKTVRMDKELVALIPPTRGMLSDMVNLGLKRILIERGLYHESDEGRRKESTPTTD